MLAISKILDIVSLLGILFLLVMYLFMHWSFTPLALTLIAVLFIRLIAQTIKARYFEKQYNKLKEKTQDIVDSLQ
ncbi:MAG: hypothetical protein SPK52_05005 [Synergistales bacterium]|nr:hypothetical protein [Bacteroidales bacterium]MDY6435556.1 hypothetical protein [Synergistales bacterium]MDY6393790.1 hypothetical protein [Bacteroidales bacterium]MDY6395815.1 hypothetical protein [Bacteroidales bacterium]MDY6402805.1 hypothetical protein [Bacteroidales bacterium]